MNSRSLLLLSLALALTSSAKDWPQWRGPMRNGISDETGLLQEWPKEGPPLAWQAKDLGTGYSTPAVAGATLYVISNEGLDNEFIQARTIGDGSKLWTTHIGKVGNPNQKPSYPAARSTPTIDGDALYLLGSDGDLLCLDRDGGKIRWRQNVRKDYGGQPGTWAYAESPLVDGDLLICTPGGSEATLLALNKKDGKVVWKSAIPGEQAAYSSASIIDVGGSKQYVQMIQKGLVGVDAKSGKMLWRYDKTAQGSPANIPSPVAADGYIYSSSGRGGGGLVKIKSNNGTMEPEQIYAESKLPTSIGGAIKVGDYLYGTTGQALVCSDFKTGAIKWQDRGVGPGSLCFADGRIYLHGENGDVALVEASPEAYHEKGRFTPPNPPNRGQSKAWAYPVVANGRLYIRDMGSLWAFDIKQK